MNGLAGGLLPKSPHHRAGGHGRQISWVVDARLVAAGAKLVPTSSAEIGAKSLDAFAALLEGKAWVDFDVAGHALGVALGVFPV